MPKKNNKNQRPLKFTTNLCDGIFFQEYSIIDGLDIIMNKGKLIVIDAKET